MRDATSEAPDRMLGRQTRGFDSIARNGRAENATRWGGWARVSVSERGHPQSNRRVVKIRLKYSASASPILLAPRVGLGNAYFQHFMRNSGLGCPILGCFMPKLPWP